MLIIPLSTFLSILAHPGGLSCPLVNMSFLFLSLFLSFLTPSCALPFKPDLLPQAFIGAIVAPATPVVADTAVWPNGAPASPSSFGSPVLFLPQRPSSYDPSNPQDPPSTPGASLTPLMMAYYPSWVSNVLLPEAIDLSRFDWIDFAFAVPNDSFALNWDGSDGAPDLLSRLVAVAHQHDKKVKLSLGGWDGSKCVGLHPTL
jgi:hypothetical protein